MAELVRRSLRMNPSRVIVGEVLGDEIVTMLNAMTQGNDGSLSTIHANSSMEVFNRIATYALQARERLPIEATHMLIAGAIDFVVFIEKRNDYHRGGTLRRYVSSIREVNGCDGRVLSSEVFAPGPDGSGLPHAPISCMEELAAYGYNPGGCGDDHFRPAGAAAGALTGAGLFLLFSLPVRPAPPAFAAQAPHWSRSLSTRVAVAGVAATVVLVVTGWPVVAVGPSLLVFAWRGLSGGAAEERGAMHRLEGLAAWTESLRDTIAGAAGLEQAIPSSIRAAAPTLRPHLRALVDRLHTRMALPDALALFADELDDPSADLVVAALMLNSRLRGPGLRDVLGALAVSAREELDMRRRVEAERRATRRSVQIVVITALAFAALLVVFNPAYVGEYARPARPGGARHRGRRCSAPGSPGCGAWPGSTSPRDCSWRQADHG